MIKKYCIKKVVNKYFIIPLTTPCVGVSVERSNAEL